MGEGIKAQQFPVPPKEAAPFNPEQAMAFVQDIDEPGTAFTVINRHTDVEARRELPELLQKITKSGFYSLVGQSYVYYFNILGRTAEGEKKIQDTHWAENGQAITLLFDTQQLRESTPVQEHDESPRGENLYSAIVGPFNPEYGLAWRKYSRTVRDELYSKTGDNRVPPNEVYEECRKRIRVVKEELKEGTADDSIEPNLLELAQTTSEDIKEYPLSDWGFIAAGELAADKFRGLVVPDSWSESHIQNVIERMQGRTIPIVPIYTYSGDMLWPRKLTHAEIQKLKESRGNV